MKDESIVFLDGPDWVFEWGPIEVDFHHYMGPSFFLFGKAVYPRRFNPLWILFNILQKKYGKEKKNDCT